MQSFEKLRLKPNPSSISDTQEDLKLEKGPFKGLQISKTSEPIRKQHRLSSGSVQTGSQNAANYAHFTTKELGSEMLLV